MTLRAIHRDLLNRKQDPTKAECQNFMESAAKEGLWIEILETYEFLQRRNMLLSLKGYVPTFIACCHLGSQNKAKSILSQMDEKHLPNGNLRVWKGLSNVWEADWSESGPIFGVATLTASPKLKSRDEMRDIVSKAFQQLRVNLRDRRSMPYEYDDLMRFCGGAGMNEEILQCLSDMKDTGVFIWKKSFHRALIAASRLDAATYLARTSGKESEDKQILEPSTRIKWVLAEMRQARLDEGDPRLPSKMVYKMRLTPEVLQQILIHQNMTSESSGHDDFMSTVVTESLRAPLMKHDLPVIYALFREAGLLRHQAVVRKMALAFGNARDWAHTLKALAMLNDKGHASSKDLHMWTYEFVAHAHQHNWDEAQSTLLHMEGWGLQPLEFAMVELLKLLASLDAVTERDIVKDFIRQLSADERRRRRAGSLED